MSLEAQSMSCCQSSGVDWGHWSHRLGSNCLPPTLATAHHHRQKHDRAVQWTWRRLGRGGRTGSGGGRVGIWACLESTGGVGLSTGPQCPGHLCRRLCCPHSVSTVSLECSASLPERRPAIGQLQGPVPSVRGRSLALRRAAEQRPA